MVGVEATANHEGSVEQVPWLKCDAMKCNSVLIMNADECGKGSSGSSGGFLQTYKRRKHRKCSSEGNKSPEDEKPSIEASVQMLDKWKNLVFEHFYQSLIGDQDGIRASFHNAFMKMESDSSTDYMHTFSTQRGWMPRGTLCHNEGNFHVSRNGVTKNPCVADMCRHFFCSIVLSDKFASLCELIHENFQGVKVDNFFNLDLISKRMKEGTYEHSPFLLSADFERLWSKIQTIGTQLTSVAKSLSDVSVTPYNHKERDSPHGSSEEGKHESFHKFAAPNQFCFRESDSSEELDQKETSYMYKVCSCRHCGNKAYGVDCLVCDSCEEIYHISCIKPPIKEIPSKSWHCASCIAIGIGSPHDNCKVCERLNTCRPSLNQPNNQINVTKGATMYNECKETSNDRTCGGFKIERECLCKICGSEVKDGEKFKICDHKFCPNKYYHVRCLTIAQLNCYGPEWYCPSCLCSVCLTDKDDDKIALCDSCDNAYHIYCMTPPQSSVPEGNWFCRQCEWKIQELHRIKKVYEKCENTLKGNKGLVNQVVRKKMSARNAKRDPIKVGREWTSC